MFRYEMKKLFWKKSLLLILLLFTVIDVAKVRQEYHSTTYLTDDRAEGMMSWKEAFWKLYGQYGGRLTEKKMNAFLKQYQPLQEETADMTASSIADDPQYMTGSAWQDFNLMEKYYEMPMKYFYLYGKNAEKAAKKAKENISFYQEHGNSFEEKKNAVIYHLYQGREIRDFSYMEMIHYYLYYDFSSVLIFLLCIYGIVRVFACEREAQMEELTVVSVNGGRRLVRHKILAVALYTVLISLWFGLVDFFSFAWFYQSLEGMGMPIYAVENFACASVGCSIWQYVMLSFAARTLGFLVFGMFFLLLSECCKNALMPFVLSVMASIASIFIGDYFAHSSHILCKVLNPYFLVTNRLLFGRTEFVDVFGAPVLCYEMALAVGIFLCLSFIFAVGILARKNVMCHGKGKGRFGRRERHAVVSL